MLSTNNRIQEAGPHLNNSESSFESMNIHADLKSFRGSVWVKNPKAHFDPS